MPFLIAIAIYAYRIARRPMDVRLKKRHVGPLSVICLAIVLYLAWDWVKPAGVGLEYFAGEFSGVASMYLMVCVLVLATRLRWLEQWFGGLDRMYFWHRQYALVSIVLLVPHILLTGRTTVPGAAEATAQLAQTARLLGAGSAIGLLALVAISLARVGRLLRLPYERWLLLHRFIGLLVASALVHGFILDGIIRGSLFLRTLYVLIGATGMAAYAYDELVMRQRTPRADYTVRTIARPSPDVLDVTLAPKGVAPLSVKGGQFVYLRVGGGRAYREHPFSVAGIQTDGSVRLTVRALGRDTRRLYSDLREGLPAVLNGPYGMFDHTLGGERQIWVAGGIGIAPFLGWISAAQPEQLPQVDLFYCIPSADEAPFLGELSEMSQERRDIALHTVYSRSQGRLTLEKIEAAAGSLTPDTHVFVCGPAGMVEKLSIELRKRGISRHQLHAEHFAFR